ncbi:MAG: hypothetical protein AAB513_00960 [Patescibacteria group bacterium]|mgnify:CR=1 FL=1
MLEVLSLALNKDLSQLLSLRGGLMVTKGDLFDLLLGIFLFGVLLAGYWVVSSARRKSEGYVFVSGLSFAVSPKEEKEKEGTKLSELILLVMTIFFSYLAEVLLGENEEKPLLFYCRHYGHPLYPSDFLGRVKPSTSGDLRYTYRCRECQGTGSHVLLNRADIERVEAWLSQKKIPR